jgi:hypothetical protein
MMRCGVMVICMTRMRLGGKRGANAVAVATWGCLCVIDKSRHVHSPDLFPKSIFIGQRV